MKDPYPLVVRLPCHKSHMFDLECIGPWLRLHSTCPLDRKDLFSRDTQAGGGVSSGSGQGQGSRGRGADENHEEHEEEDEEDLVNGLYA